MFQNPDLYNNNNQVAVREAQEALEKYHKYIKFNGNDVILDVGSGSGNVTLGVLLPRIPQDNFRLIGTDRLQCMVDYANEKVKDSRVTFRVANMNWRIEEIKSVFTDEEVKPGFSHVVSFNCLQYNTHVLPQCYKNMFDLLRPGGQLFVLKMGYSILNDIWESVHKLEKWQQYIKDEAVFSYPYHKSMNPVKECTNMLKKIGFEINICSFERKPMFPEGYPAPIERSLMEFLEPYIHAIPQRLRSEYLDDVMEVYEYFKKQNPDFLFDSIVCIGTKPLHRFSTNQDC